jgi:hypothetical protein
MHDRELPVGNVTVLLTDIEGSTQLIEKLGEEGYVRALGEHRPLLRAAFSPHRGVEVDTQGDAFLYSFADPVEALAAAAEGQHALASGEVKVRMGLQTGALQPRRLPATLDSSRRTDGVLRVPRGIGRGRRGTRRDGSRRLTARSSRCAWRGDRLPPARGARTARADRDRPRRRRRTGHSQIGRTSDDTGRRRRVRSQRRQIGGAIRLAACRTS